MTNLKNKKLIILTGANGHLGNNIVELIKQIDKDNNYFIHGLVYELNPSLKDDSHIKYIKGDIKDINSLLPLFNKKNEYNELFLIHTAAIISINDDIDDLLYETNVIGTKNILELSIKYCIKKFIYISSVHAISNVKKSNDSSNKKIFEFDVDKLIGGYAKSKAMATNLVLDYINKYNLDASILLPSGIIGPNYLDLSNNLVKLVNDYINGKLVIGVKGGYDFVDVRDVALAAINSLDKAKKGKFYILSNRHYEIKQLFNIIASYVKVRQIPCISLRLARIFLPLISFISKKKGSSPLFSKYSLYVLNSKDKFSYEDARLDLDYKPRLLNETIFDMIKNMNIEDKKLKI